MRAWRNPGFSLTVVLTLALGIGATTALFTVVNAVLIDPLPFPQSRALIQVWRSELPALTYGSASYLRYLDWRRDQRVFTDLGAWAPRGMTVAGPDGPERIGGAIASASFFRVIGATPALGRWISDDDDRPGSDGVAVISEGLWRRRFNATASAIGARLVIDGEPFTVVGVAPGAYSEIWRPDVWIPLGRVPGLTNRDNNFLLSFGRLRDGESLDAARRGLEGLAAALGRDHPEDKYGFTARPLYEIVTEGASRGLWVLLGASGLLLLIACVNVANLLLARAVETERDLAIRASLGASLSRLIGHVMGEIVLLGLAAGALGTAMAWGLVRIFVAMAPASFPRIAAIAIDGRVLGFSLLAAVAASLAAGLAPAIHVLRSDVTAAVRGAATRSVTAGRARAASRWLVGVEMAIAVALVITAGLMVKSLLLLQSQDLGLTRDRVLTFSLGVPAFVAADGPGVARFQGVFLDRVRALPGVTHASAINLLPIASTGSNGPVRRVDQSGEGEAVPVTEFRTVMDGYFAAMDVRLVAGRAIDDRDMAGTTTVAVVNETLAARLFPGLAPAQMLGRQIKIGWLRGTASEVVGVSADVRSRRPDVPPDPEVYVPFAQLPQATMTYVVRAKGDPASLAGAIRAELRSMSPQVAIASVRMLDEVVSAATRMSRLLSWLSVLFGAIAGALAVVGIYSVLSYAVAQREREMAIRSAVGASPFQLITLILREGLTVSGIGIAAGAGAAFLASSVLSALLYEVSATDPLTFGAAAVAFAGVAAAGYLKPAIRASRVDPVAALR